MDPVARYRKRTELACILPDGRILLRLAAIMVTVGPYSSISWRMHPRERTKPVKA